MGDISQDGDGTSGPPAAAPTRTAMPRRFYTEVDVAQGSDGFEVRLDGRPVRTPSHHLLVAPVRHLAEAIASEWAAQGEYLDRSTMPLTQLAYTVLDKVRTKPEPLAAEVARYLASDLVCYRAQSPAGLARRQAEHWNAVIDWAARELGARFAVAEGVTFLEQPPAALERARAAIPTDPWLLGAVHRVTTLTGSALLALALLRGFLDPEAVWGAAHVDEDWNMEIWGQDAVALKRRAFQRAELAAAYTVIATLA
jgi:chaperone required for assembly of F1-ATPase